MRENREAHTSKRKKRPTAKKYAKQSMTREEHRKHLKRLYLKTLLITLAVCLALLGAAYGVFLYMIGGLDRTEVDEDNLSVNESVNEKVINIALYGVDSRNHDYNGRSDVVMVASVNTKTGIPMLPSPATITPASTMPFPMAGLSLPSAPSMKISAWMSPITSPSISIPSQR